MSECHSGFFSDVSNLEAPPPPTITNDQAIRCVDDQLYQCKSNELHGAADYFIKWNVRQKVLLGLAAFLTRPSAFCHSWRPKIAAEVATPCGPATMVIWWHEFEPDSTKLVKLKIVFSWLFQCFEDHKSYRNIGSLFIFALNWATFVRSQKSWAAIRMQ